MKSFTQTIEFITRHWQVITLGTLVLISVASLFPAEHLPAVPGTDKTHHFISYCILMLPLAIKRPKFWPAIACVLLIWSGFIELIQPYVNRYGEWYDFYANAAGIILGLVLGVLLKCLYCHIQNRNENNS